MNRRALTLVALPLLAVGLLAQNKSQPKPKTLPAVPAPDMTRQPQPGPLQPYAPPTSQTDQLPNGLKIIVIEDHRFPLVSVRIALRAGNSRLAPEDAGLAQAEADLLTEGTTTRSALQIAEEADGLGGSLGASAGPDFLEIDGDALAPSAQNLIRLMADVVLHPAFPEDEVKLRTGNMLDELQQNRADPGFLAGVAFNKLLFGPHPYAVTAPTAASIARITRQALVDFHTKYFIPNNQATVVVSGDVVEARAHAWVDQYFGDWKFQQIAPPPSPPVANPPGRKIYLIDRPGSAQSTILLGNLGLTRRAPDYFPFLVANEVLGGSFNSRLIADIREQKGYAYGIDSGNVPYSELGAWQVNTQVRTPVTADALQEILLQLDKIRAAEVTPQELAQAKSFLAGNFVLGLQTQAEVAEQFLTTDIYGLPADRLATWVNKVQAVDAGQVKDAADKYMLPDHEVVVVVGDLKQIEGPLANLAKGSTLTLLDDKGNPVGTYPPEGPSHQ